MKTVQTVNKWQVLEERVEELAAAIVARQWEQQPHLVARYDDNGRAKCVRDVSYTLRYLTHALQSQEAALFANYIAWVKILFAKLNIADEELVESLRCTEFILRRELPAPEAALASAMLTATLDQMPHMPLTLPSYINDASPHGVIAQTYLDHLLKGERRQASGLVLDMAAQGVPVRDIYLDVFQPAQYEVGRLWQTSQISVAQEHFCTAATQQIMSQLYPYIFATPKQGKRMVATCVGDEMHEIGVRMVADLFEMDGWDTYYLGSNTPTASVVAAVKEQNADILAISATMTFHLGAVADLITSVRQGVPDRRLKIIVGGYPFNAAPDLWQHIGADGFAPDALTALAVANQLLQETS